MATNKTQIEVRRKQKKKKGERKNRGKVTEVVVL